MVTAEDLAARQAAIEQSPDLQGLRAHLRERAKPLLERAPHIPDAKALLSVDGGVCPADGAPLAFDPWSPREHQCPVCQAVYTGERHDRHWARYQHLWLAERAAHLATLGAFGDAAAAARAREILSGYAARYLRYPNRDNVLGPSRLFFSTYLESIWICNYLAAAMLLRESGQMDEATEGGVAQVADEAANLIGEFDEWFSNRQTWNNAALTAIAVWFEDEQLAELAVGGPMGLVAHLARGFGRDGMWYEGENYHLFALRALLTGAAWARHAGLDLFREAGASARLGAALLAPAATALPDVTYPARKDSRFGVSLAQPAHLDLWELGLARLALAGEGKDSPLPGWLAALYRVPAAPELMESYLHDAPLDRRPVAHSRASLSWLSLLEMLPELPHSGSAWSPRSTLLEVQGLAVLRTGDRYVSLEAGPSGGGHGHFDRLHLTLSASGVHWLPDVGTASYVTRELYWYRSTIAHNAPRLDGRSQPLGDATCEAFDDKGAWAWARGRYGEFSRAVVSGPSYLVDLLDFASPEEHLVELPWHLSGDVAVETEGTWDPAPDTIADPFVSGVERLAARGAPVFCSAVVGERRLRVCFAGAGDVLRAEGPGRPGMGGERLKFLVRRARSRGVRFVTVLETVVDSPSVRDVRIRGDVIEVETTRGVDRHAIQAAGWTIDGPAGAIRLAGRRQPEAPFEPFLEVNTPTKARASALRVDTPPALDGTLAGFDTSEPLVLDVEDQYRRSEEAYPGPDDFSATAYVNWGDDALYVAVDVVKPELCLRPADAPPLRLDNEPDDIHSDGVQLYLGEGEQREVLGFLIVPEGEERGGLRVRAVAGTAAREDMIQGAWERTDSGYRVTVALAFSEGVLAHPGGRLGFDLLVNEMLPDRMRRAGQLVWSGGNGWVWLRGNRQGTDRFGVLDLLG